MFANLPTLCAFVAENDLCCLLKINVYSQLKSWNVSPLLQIFRMEFVLSIPRRTGMQAWLTLGSIYPKGDSRAEFIWRQQVPRGSQPHSQGFGKTYPHLNCFPQYHFLAYSECPNWSLCHPPTDLFTPKMCCKLHSPQLPARAFLSLSQSLSFSLSHSARF